MYPKIKRAGDFLLSLTGIIFTGWLMAIIAVCIKAESKGNVIFKQKRIGQGKKDFYIYKFRTMYTDTPKDMPTHLLKDPEAYITRCGKILRRTSLDELPQFFNILKGDMSIIGPRPALWNQYDLIAERDKYEANDVPVGLTGWAQINGRDELSIVDKARFDGEYTRKMSLLFDIKIFFMTIASVFSEKGVVEGYQDNSRNEESKSV
ncbi:MAG: sugar transferase [Firmicutes bacterium]|nr:sugar transferase [Bacillota bacterium]